MFRHRYRQSKIDIWERKTEYKVSQQVLRKAARETQECIGIITVNYSERNWLVYTYNLRTHIFTSTSTRLDVASTILIIRSDLFQRPYYSRLISQLLEGERANSHLDRHMMSLPNWPPYDDYVSGYLSLHKVWPKVMNHGTEGEPVSPGGGHV